MKRTLTLYIIGAMAWSLTPLPAQPEDPRPQEPILSHLPEFAAWTITYRYKTEEPAAGEAPVTPGERLDTITTTKTGKTYWEISSYNTGRASEKWILDGLQLLTPPGSSAVVTISEPIDEDSPSPYFSNYAESDFPDLSWITMKNYVGVETFQGQRVFRFTSGEQSAVITVESQRPLVVQHGMITRIYTYLTPPAQPLVAPRRFAKVAETHRRGMELLKQHPSLP